MFNVPTTIFVSLFGYLLQHVPGLKIYDVWMKKQKLKVSFVVEVTEEWQLFGEKV
jgi:hypothetical protein